MSEKPFTLVVRLAAKGGMSDQLIAIMQPLVNYSQTEPGCLSYILYKSSKNPDEFMVYEIWQDHASLLKHQQTPVFKETIAQLTAILSHPPEHNEWTTTTI